ncbi:kinase-like protein [Gigaspora margarita]|uniref:Kinase-like protein n=1 Tax=Gigaspora margarita TaxID=4874 RepID=A0A8H3XBU6_GIGMA|nr:kinase-like protein [Gigaspora margarita]
MLTFSHQYNYQLNIISLPNSSVLIGKERLGRGEFGTVYRATSLSLGYVAIKEVDSEKDEKAQKIFIKELKQLSRSSHVRIIKFYGISLDSQKKTHYIVMEYANNGTLRDYLRSYELKWPEKILLASQIAEGMTDLHSIDIIPRDLHTLNILIHDKSVKISDFGLSKNLNSSATTSSKGFYGVMPFIDPRKLDVYSIGVLMWEISSNGQPPFGQSNDPYGLLIKLITGSREEPIAGTPNQYIDLYSECWDYEPNNRPSMEEIFRRLNSLILDSKYDETNLISF